MPENSLRNIRVQFLQFSTGNPHPAAEQSSVFLGVSLSPSPGWDDVVLAVSGNTLAIFQTALKEPQIFYILDWKTGNLKLVSALHEFQTYSTQTNCGSG